MSKAIVSSRHVGVCKVLGSPLSFLPLVLKQSNLFSLVLPRLSCIHGFNPSRAQKMGLAIGLQAKMTHFHRSKVVLVRDRTLGRKLLSRDDVLAGLSGQIFYFMGLVEGCNPSPTRQVVFPLVNFHEIYFLSQYYRQCPMPSLTPRQPSTGFGCQFYDTYFGHTVVYVLLV